MGGMPETKVEIFKDISGCKLVATLVHPFYKTFCFSLCDGLVYTTLGFTTSCQPLVPILSRLFCSESVGCQQRP